MVSSSTFLNWDKQTWYWEKGGYFRLGMGPKEKGKNARLLLAKCQLRVIHILVVAFIMSQSQLCFLCTVKAPNIDC